MAKALYNNPSTNDIVNQLRQQAGVASGDVLAINTDGYPQFLPAAAPPAGTVTAPVALTPGEVVVALSAAEVETTGLEAADLVVVTAPMTPGEIVIATGAAEVESTGILLSALPVVFSVTLTDAQIKALPTSGPITLVPAPGAGWTFRPIAQIMFITIVTPYGNASTGRLQTNLGTDGISFFTPSNIDLGDQNLFLDSQGYIYAQQSIAGGGLIISLFENLPYVIEIASSGSNFTGGNPANRLTISVVGYFLPIS